MNIPLEAADTFRYQLRIRERGSLLEAAELSENAHSARAKGFPSGFSVRKERNHYLQKVESLRMKWEGNWDGKCVLHVFIRLML